MTKTVKKCSKKLLIVASMLQMNLALSQDWRADVENGSGEGGITLILILALIAIYLEFKKSVRQGFLALLYAGGIIGLSIIFPKFGGIVIGILLIAVIYAVAKNYWR